MTNGSFYILSLGCPKNTVESEWMAELLNHAGYQEQPTPDTAQVLIVNTCGFIELARAESLGALRDLAQEKRADQLLIAAGCLSQLFGRRLMKQIPEIAALISTREWHQIVSCVERALAREKRKTTPFAPATEREILRHAHQPATAYLKIADGCDAACAFCTIPIIKGAYHSRSRAEIITEARYLVEAGVRELILIAQDTTAYGCDRGEKDVLPDLLEDILRAIPQLDWLRIMYTYPQHISPRLIETMARYPQICSYLDLPLQHAHPDVLRRMHRPHDVDRTRETIAALRAAMPEIAIRTTFIVGYPGETDTEFATLLDFMDEVAFDRVGIFAYSREAGTPAARLSDQVPTEVQEERRARAMELQQAISLELNERLVGQELSVLIEGCGEGISVGRSYRDAPEVDGMILIPAELSPGQFVSARITQALEYDLVGEVA